MPEKYTRREFSKIAGATATFQLGDDDDEDGILSRIFGDDEQSSSSNTEGAVYVDAENELESVNPGPNEVFITTDTDRIFKPTDEGKWTEFASLGGDSPWVKNADGTLTPENGEPVNVGSLSNTNGDPRTGDISVSIFKDGSDIVAIDEFGNRVSRNADFATVLQAAIDSLPNPDDPQASGGGSIQIKRGTYLLSSTVTLNTSVFIRGEGMRTTQIKLAGGADANMFAINRASRVPFCGFDNIKLEGNKANNTAGTIIRHETNVTDVLIRNTWIDSAPDNGYEVAAPSNDTWNIWFDQALIEGSNNVDILLDGSGTGSISNVYVTDCYFIAPATAIQTVGTVDGLYLESQFRDNEGDVADIDLSSNTQNVVYEGRGANITGNRGVVWYHGTNYDYDDVEVLNTTSPATTYTSIDLSANVPPFAQGVLLDTGIDGTGTAGQGFIKMREGGTTRGRDVIVTINGDETFRHFNGPYMTPLSASKTIEYEVGGEISAARLAIQGVVA